MAPDGSWIWQGEQAGVYDNAWADLDDSPAVWCVHSVQCAALLSSD